MGVSEMRVGRPLKRRNRPLGSQSLVNEMLAYAMGVYKSNNQGDSMPKPFSYGEIRLLEIGGEYHEARIGGYTGQQKRENKLSFDREY